MWENPPLVVSDSPISFAAFGGRVAGSLMQSLSRLANWQQARVMRTAYAGAAQESESKTMLDWPAASRTAELRTGIERRAGIGKSTAMVETLLRWRDRPISLIFSPRALLAGLVRGERPAGPLGISRVWAAGRRYAASRWSAACDAFPQRSIALRDAGGETPRCGGGGNTASQVRPCFGDFREGGRMLPYGRIRRF